MNNIENTPLLSIGYRPFFLLACVYSILSIAVWMAFYAKGYAPMHASLAPVTWHAHEMLFGYATAVIAGFLLTAVRNWTQLETARGKTLAALALVWCVPRILLITATATPLLFIAAVDLVFLVLLIFVITRPIVHCKQWRQAGIVSKLILLLLSNAVFYIGAVNSDPALIHVGLYSGLYMIIALILVMARRLIPFFAKSTLGADLLCRTWLDRSSLLLFLLFWLAIVFLPGNTHLAAVLAAALFCLHAVRLWDWYLREIWQHPLLWVLYLAYATVVIGFATKALETTLNLSPFLAVHAFAFGGVGIMTLGMMARVAWGHSGRDLRNTPAVLLPSFALLAVGGLIRVLLPAIWPAATLQWVMISGSLWLCSFLIFAWAYLPIMIQPRADS